MEVASPVLRTTGVRCLLGVPLRTREQVVGVAQVGRLQPQPFTDDELRFLQIIADRLAAAIDNSRLYARLRHQLEQLRLEREIRERFVSTLAHDLRSPLTAARMSAHLVLRYPDQAAGRERQLGRLIQSLTRAEQMIENLLDANRIRAGERLPLEITECDLVATAREVCEELSMVLGNRFAVRGPERLAGHWSCNGLRRVLENLLTNGAKYGAPATPVITTIEARGTEAWITVHNEGPPIPPAELDRLFDPFHRAGGARVQGKPGWGLGLTLVKGLTEAHGGRISVESSAEAGTTFRVQLPRDARSAQEPRA
jgi:signal transduction histidine kinase